MSLMTDKPREARSVVSEPASQTAQEYECARRVVDEDMLIRIRYIKSQLDLEEEAKEALPYVRRYDPVITIATDRSL